MADFHPMKAPDYSKQTWSDSPKGDVFADVNKKPVYEKQGDPSSPVLEDDFEQEGRQGRFQREPSGATSARSASSASRSRSGTVADIVQSSTGTASMSPSRAMGARSGSIDRSARRQYSGLDTLEGVGSSMAPVVNPDALDGRRGRPGYQTQKNTVLREQVGSPTGARSVSASRAIQEEQFRAVDFVTKKIH